MKKWTAIFEDERGRKRQRTFHAPTGAQATSAAHATARREGWYFLRVGRSKLGKTPRRHTTSKDGKATAPVRVIAEPPYGFTVSVTVPRGRRRDLVVIAEYETRAMAQAAARKARSVVKARRLSAAAVARILAEEGVRSNPVHAKRFEYRYPVPPGPTGNWSEDDWHRYEDSRGSWVDTEPETLPWSDTQHSVKTGRRTAKGEMLYRLAPKLTLTEHDLVGDEWDVWGMINAAMTTDAEELHAQYQRFDSSMTLRHIRKALKGLLDKGFISRATGMGRGVHKTKPLTYIGKKNPRQPTDGEWVVYAFSVEEARERAKADAPRGYEPYDFGLYGHPMYSDEYRYKLRKKAKKRSKKSRKGKSLKGKWRATQRLNPRRRG
jgi:hypothetical protein